MSPTRPSRPTPHTQRGASLLESLIAFVVLAASTVAVAHLQGGLRLDGDLARQRSEALRIGEAEIEELRAFSAMTVASGVRSYAAIADAETTVAGGNASYRVVRTIEAGTGAKATSVRVGWTDRAGTAREIELASIVAAVDPAYAGALALGAGAIPAASRGALGRSPAVPVAARDLGDGSSVWKPAAAATVAAVFDNASGDIVASCSVAATTSARDLSTADLAGCVAGRRLLVGGTIRFTSAMPPLPAAASEVPPEVAVAMALSGSSYTAAAVCSSEARKTVRYLAAGSLRVDAVAIDATPASLGIASWDDSGDRFVAWSCIVAPRADGRWSGRTSLVAAGGWTIGTASIDRRVCRFAADGDGSGAVDANGEHPRDYVDVGAALLAQNFLVVGGGSACPAAPDRRADLGTEPHQP